MGPPIVSGRTVASKSRLRMVAIVRTETDAKSAAAEVWTSDRDSQMAAPARTKGGARNRLR